MSKDTAAADPASDAMPLQDPVEPARPANRHPCVQPGFALQVHALIRTSPEARKPAGQAENR
jgi:hypothetical protein